MSCGKCIYACKNELKGVHPREDTRCACMCEGGQTVKVAIDMEFVINIFLNMTYTKVFPNPIQIFIEKILAVLVGESLI